MSGRKQMLGKKTDFYDYSLLFVVLFLCCFGLIMVYSASYYTARVQGYADTYYLAKQARWYIVGAFGMVLVSLIPPRFWAAMTAPAYVVAVIIMILTDFTSLGKELNGKKRWLKLPGGNTIQSAEVVKIALILFMAFCLVRYGRHLNEKKNLLIMGGCIAFPILLVLKNNLSSAVVIFMICLLMFFVVSKRKKLFLLIVAGVVLIVLLAIFGGNLLVKLHVLQPYQLTRINVWLDPETYAQDGGYQVLQGLYAIGSGGFFGKGLGNGTQKLGFVPEASNDMIFSIVCEELGLFGAFCLILLFVFLLYRMMMIALNAPDRHSFLLVVGVMCHIGVQVVLHIAVVTGVIPNTGVTLPFISYGGSSVVFLMAEIGIVLGVSRQIDEKERGEAARMGEDNDTSFRGLS